MPRSRPIAARSTRSSSITAAASSKIPATAFCSNFRASSARSRRRSRCRRLMAERNHHLPADRVMHFRMGIHMGDVMADEDEVFGDDVNIAVRLQTVAAPGGIAVSDKAYARGRQAPQRHARRCRPASLQEYRRSGPCLDLGAGRARRSEPRSRRRIDLPAQYRTAIVGVLPFDNLSGSADEYFSDGLTEDLIHALSLQSFYRVLSRSSTFAFKGKNVEHAPDRARDRRDLSDPGLGPARRQQDPRHRRTDRAGKRRAALDRPLRPRHRRPVRAAGRDHDQPVGRDRAGNFPRGSIGAGARDHPI